MQRSTPAIQPSYFYRNHFIRDAISQAIYDTMSIDPSIYLMGEGAWVKARYDAPKLLDDFPNRIVTLPIAEDGSTNFAVGASLLGIKPIIDEITADFLYRCFDSIANTAAKLNFVLPDSEPPRTMVIRAEFLTGGPTTGQRPEALFTHIPGLNVVVPSTPRDAYGLMRTALETPGVTLFFEDRMIEDSYTQIQDLDYGPGCHLYMGQDSIPFGRAYYRAVTGNPKLTVITYGLMRQLTELVIGQADIHGVLLLDLRTLYPLDWGEVMDCTKRSQRLLIIEPDVQYGGIGAEIAATIAEKFPGVVVRRLGGPREMIPVSRDGQARFIPTKKLILEAIRGLIFV